MLTHLVRHCTRFRMTLYVVLLLSATAGCESPVAPSSTLAPSAPNATSSIAPPTTATQASAHATIFPSISATPVPSNTQVAEVASVVDGDTIDVRLDGKTQRVRFILVDTPEVFGGTDCFGPEASAFTKRTLQAGTKVSLEKDVSETDRFGRLLRYVYLPDGRMLNEILVAEGYAQVATFPPDVKYQQRMLAAQRVAREGRKGLWSACSAGVAPSATTTATALAASGPALRYDPFGPDRDCGDFATHAEAQAFFIAAGGPGSDRHRLDANRDGVACEALP